ncbi:MAG: hypothetical protein KJ674_03230 [Nanoarchaeota archaeon]|nr:hypothetical protein [Nanoarchaeota archaeon]
MKKRVSFVKGEQERFIRYLKDKTKLGFKNLSQELDIPEGTLKSYNYEFCDIPYDLFKKILKLIKAEKDEILEEYKGEVRNEVLIIGRKCFGEQKKVLNKIKIDFENQELSLDISNINFSRYDLIKEIILPDKITPQLAEEIGMHYGDGFLSEKRYDYRLKGNPKDEVEYYQNYIKPLFKNLYNANINLKESYKSYGFELRSKAIWEFKTKVLGIKPGKKYSISIPERLKVNDINIITSFIRGLFDTDGCLSFKTRYGYEKYYPCISIALTSKGLIKEVGEILNMLGFAPSISYNNKYGRISIYGIKAFKRYEKLIGWRSQKNLNRLNNWKNRYPQLNKIKMADVV